MKQTSYVIGLDGGGTKTAAELCDLSGKPLVSLQDGPSNFQVIGVPRAAETILNLVTRCCESVGCTVGEIKAVVAGLTGAGRTADQERMEEGLRAVAAQRGVPLDRVSVQSDARIALEGAFLGGPGIIVIAGTGSIVFGKDASGTVHRAGGWGRLLSDEGSGYTIGKEALRMAAKQIDGLAKRSLLLDFLDRDFHLGTQETIIRAVYKDSFDIASVVPVVMEAATRNDTAARKILTDAAKELLSVIGGVRKKMNDGRGRKIPLAFAGSLLTNENWYSRHLRAEVRKRFPAIKVQKAEATPVHGAALMALQLVSTTK